MIRTPCKLQLGRDHQPFSNNSSLVNTGQATVTHLIKPLFITSLQTPPIVSKNTCKVIWLLTCIPSINQHWLKVWRYSRENFLSHVVAVYTSACESLAVSDRSVCATCLSLTTPPPARSATVHVVHRATQHSTAHGQCQAGLFLSPYSESTTDRRFSVFALWLSDLCCCDGLPPSMTDHHHTCRRSDRMDCFHAGI